MLGIVSIGLQSIAILIVVGMIIGTWIASGTVPYIIYAGLNLLTPQWFPLQACCCVRWCRCP